MAAISEAKTQAAHHKRKGSCQEDGLEHLKTQVSGNRDFMSWMLTIIAIDQGTNSSRAILFDEDGDPCAEKRRVSADFPAGWLGRT